MNVYSILRRSNSWPDFKALVRGFSEKEKGNCFEALTKCFLQLDPKYMTLLKNVWLLREVPRRVHDHLNLPGPDEGIDLVAETKNGTYWTIQSKYREDESKSLTREQLSTFTNLSFVICKNVDFALVCTTVDRFSHKLSLYGKKLGFCAGDVWRELDVNFFDRLHRLLDGKVVLLKHLKPRPHQKGAIRSAQKHFVREGNSRGKLIMPCGTGKTLVGFWIAEKLAAQTILVAMPSLALIRQTLEVWAREFVTRKRAVRWIAVCSDESVGDIERDDVMSLTQDLGIRVDTEPNEIARWLKGKRKGCTVVFTTYQSGRAIAKAARKAKITFDIGIMDEAHKTVGKKESLFSHLLFDRHIRIKRRIFMTATERHYRGQSDQIVSMDDPDLYGETFELLSFKKALEATPPILSDYKIVTMGVTRNEIAELIKRNVFVRPDKGKWDSDVEAEMLAALIALRKAIQKHPIRHAVSFHTRIARAKVFKESNDAFTDAFPSYGKLETFYVFGKLPTSIRSREMDAFAAAKRSLVTNARCLTEGVDVPNIDCVLFADPKRSTIDIVQAVGRALRPSGGKQFGYILVPVLLDKKITDGKTYEQQAFGNVLIVLRAMASNDERIVEYFRGVSQGRRSRLGRDRYYVDIPEGLKVDAEKFVESVELQLWSRLAKLSWRPFEEARAFTHGLGLGSQSEWVKYRKRELPEKGTLPQDIPTSPHQVYKGQGWVGYGDWLGTGTVRPQDRTYRAFISARSFVHNLGLKGQAEWRKYCNRGLPNKGTLPRDIPSSPHVVYKDRWRGDGDWLGTGTVATQNRKFLPYKNALAFVRSLGLESQTEWFRWTKGKLPKKGMRPQNIPANPTLIYKGQGWKTYGDWLGTGTVAPRLRKYRPFKNARLFVRRLGFRSVSEWRKYSKGQLTVKGTLPEDIPSNPHVSYKDKGWINFGDWLGTGIVATKLRKYLPFKMARVFARQLGLKSRSQWNKFCRGELPEKGTLPADIPNASWVVYKKHWISMGDWLGTGTVAHQDRRYWSFKKARAFVHRLGLKSIGEWKKYCKRELPKINTRPLDVPSNPNRTYKGQDWNGWPDWLGSQK